MTVYLLSESEEDKKWSTRKMELLKLEHIANLLNPTRSIKKLSKFNVEITIVAID